MSTPTQSFKTPPPSVPNTLLSFPAQHVLLVTLNRPAQLNAIPTSQHKRLAALWDWFDAEPALRCAVITGAGRAFCAGADLKEWNELHSKFQGQQKRKDYGGEGQGLVDGVEHGGQYGTLGKRREALRKAEGVKSGEEPDALAERTSKEGHARDGKMKDKDKLTTGIGGGDGTVNNRRKAIESAAHLAEETAPKRDLSDVDDARINTGIGGGYGTVASRKAAAAAARVANNESSSRVGNLGLNAGFGGLSNRSGKKPIIAAVNGLCLGGGMEMVINCDMVIASSNARFGLPEVKVGVIAVAGALPRLVRTVGKQRAAEMALLGRNRYSAEQMERWGVVNFIVSGEQALVEEAVKLAEQVSSNSPDAVLTSKEGLRLGWEGMGPEKATAVLEGGMYRKLEKGENMREGVASFVEKRKPVWKDSKL